MLARATTLMLLGTVGENAYTQDRQENVDAEVAAAPALEEDTERGEENGEDDLADVAVGVVS